ncbi:MAG: imidazole glycerol phosphate synthase subunit HisF [Acidimicrobiales bacterium]
MESVRIIPCLDVRGGRVVKGVNFRDIKDAGDPVELAAHYEQMGADELVFLDIDASHEARGTMVELVRRTAAEVFIPLTVGGGVDSVSSAERLLRAGADKVSVNSAAIARPTLITEIAQRFGTQCVVVAIDARWEQGHYGVTSHGGRRSTALDALGWAREVVSRGAGELLVTSMDRDGTKSGYDLRLISALESQVEVPIIASGGVGSVTHFVEGAIDGGAQGLLAASVFHYREIGIAEVKDALDQAGVVVRPVQRRGSSLESH